MWKWETNPKTQRTQDTWSQTHQLHLKLLSFSHDNTHLLYIKETPRGPYRACARECPELSKVPGIFNRVRGLIPKTGSGMMPSRFSVFLLETKPPLSSSLPGLTRWIFVFWGCGELLLWNVGSVWLNRPASQLRGLRGVSYFSLDVRLSSGLLRWRDTLDLFWTELDLHWFLPGCTDTKACFNNTGLALVSTPDLQPCLIASAS